MKARDLLHYSGYVWITHGWYMNNWWENGTTECSEQQLKASLNGSIGVSHYPVNQESRVPCAYVYLPWGMGTVYTQTNIIILYCIYFSSGVMEVILLHRTGHICCMMQCGLLHLPSTQLEVMSAEKNSGMQWEISHFQAFQ